MRFEIENGILKKCFISDDIKEGVYVIVPNDVVKINRFAFSSTNCRKYIKTIALPYGITTIDDTAFNCCENLECITVSDDNESYCSIDGILYNKDATQLICYPNGKPETSFTVPDKVTIIGEYAFSCCENLESITLPETLRTICQGAFKSCNSLKSIAIPDSVENIGYDAFSDCENLTDVKIGNGIKIIDTAVFASCERPRNVTLPDSIETIEDMAFIHCENLESITLPENLKSIGKYVFVDCGLKEIIIPDSTVYIDYNVFHACLDLATVTIGRSLKKIFKDGTSTEDNFNLCQVLESINVSEQNENYCSRDGVLYSKDMKTLIRYPECKPDAEFTIPDGVETIDAYAFYDTYPLAHITIPDSVTNIRTSAFRKCVNLKTINIPDSVICIGNDAFTDCENLETAIPTIS